MDEQPGETPDAGQARHQGVIRGKGVSMMLAPSGKPDKALATQIKPHGGSLRNLL
jgi:hypothetical protein